MAMRHMTWLLLGVCVAAAWAQGPTPFTPPGPNLALNKPYTMDPLPNYGDCADPGDRTQLTDGMHTDGYFWVKPETVGWVHLRPVCITLDLGQIEPIAGVSYSTAAGVADVAWPLSILVMASDDGKSWSALGDLIPLSNKRGAPADKPYQLHTFATGDMKGHGRYVALVIEQVPYTVVDEIEVFRGDPAWVSQAPTGKLVNLSPLEYRRSRQVLDAIQHRLRTDLGTITAQLDTVKLPEADKAALRERAAKLDAEIETIETVPEDFRTVLPLNELHSRVYALQAPLWRARGLKPLTVWPGYRYDPLQPLAAPAKTPSAPPTISVRMMRNEHRAEVLNLTNAADTPQTITLGVTGLPGGSRLVTPFAVLFTDTLERQPVGAALVPCPRAGNTYTMTIPAGTTGQLWLDFGSRTFAAGDYKGALKLASDQKQTVTVPLSVHIASQTMPGDFSLAIGGWDETNNRGGYEVTAENMMPLIRKLREYGVNQPWSNPQVVPTPGEYDAEGNLTAPPDFTAWDEWVQRWKGAPYWGVFWAVRDSFKGEPMGTPRFNKMLTGWVNACMEHCAQQGITPDQIQLLLVDEPREPQQDATIIAWARPLVAAQPKLEIYNDPLHLEPEKVAPEFYKLTKVLCPNAPRFLNLGRSYQDTIVARQQAGCELWFYSCSGPSKLLDPASYYRGQFWLNLKYGGKGSLFWAFGDEAGGSWNAYIQPRACFSPLFLSKTEVTDAKQMEAIREGAEDYELFRMLQVKVGQLEGKGVSSATLTAAKTLLVEGPAQVVETMPGDNLKWHIPKDRSLADRYRLQALSLLEKLSR